MKTLPKKQANLTIGIAISDDSDLFEANRSSAERSSISVPGELPLSERPWHGTELSLFSKLQAIKSQAFSHPKAAAAASWLQNSEEVISFQKK
jgi:hypothetical protein